MKRIIILICLITMIASIPANANTLTVDESNYISTKVDLQNEKPIFLGEKTKSLGYYVVTHNDSQIFIYEFDYKLNVENKYKISKYIKIKDSRAYLGNRIDVRIKDDKLIFRSFNQANTIISIKDEKIIQTVMIPEGLHIMSTASVGNENYIFAYAYSNNEVSYKDCIFTFKDGKGFTELSMKDSKFVSDAVRHVMGERNLDSFFTNGEDMFLIGNMGAAAIKEKDSNGWMGFKINMTRELNKISNFNGRFIASSEDSSTGPVNHAIVASDDGYSWEELLDTGRYKVNSIWYDGKNYIVWANAEKVNVLFHSVNGYDWNKKYWVQDTDMHITKVNNGYLILDNSTLYLSDQLLNFDKIQFSLDVPNINNIKWESIDTKTGVKGRLNDILIDGDNIIAVGSSDRIYNTMAMLISRDGGATWKIIRDNEGYTSKEPYHVEKIKDGYIAFGWKKTYKIDVLGNYTVLNTKNTNYNKEIIEEYFKNNPTLKLYSRLYLNPLQANATIDGESLPGKISSITTYKKCIWNGKEFVLKLDMGNNNVTKTIATKDGITWYTVLGNKNYNKYFNDDEFIINKGKTHIKIEGNNRLSTSLHTSIDGGITWNEEFIEENSLLIRAKWDGEYFWIVGRGIILKGKPNSVLEN